MGYTLLNRGSAWLDRDWEKLRKRIIKKKIEGRSVTAICSEAQIGRRMFYRWWNRYQSQGWAGLEEKPKGRPAGLGPDAVIRAKVIKLCKRYEWGPKKIAGYLFPAKVTSYTITKRTRLFVKQT